MRRLLAIAFALGLALPPAAIGGAAAAQAPGAPERADDRELVVMHMTADGAIARTTLIDSLTLVGSGPVAVTDLGEGVGFRNLQGFLRPEIDGRSVRWHVDLAKKKKILTASSVEGLLPAGPPPVSVTPRYFLDGQPVPARELRRATGEVAIELRLQNDTAAMRELSFFDQRGRRVTGPLQTYVPFVASVSMQLPSEQWTRVSAPGGRVITDENGVHHVSYSPILAPLIGSTTQTVRLEGIVEDLELGMTRIVVVPLAPPGAETAEQTTGGALRLYDGLGEVDANLQKLIDGTAQLVDGLAQLQQGVVDARAGVGSIGEDDTIVDGLSQVLAGLKDLGDAEEGLPAAQVGLALLIEGVEEILAGIGSTSTDDTILGGLSDVADGIDAANAGIPLLDAGLESIEDTIGSAAPDPAVIGVTPAPSAGTSARYDVEYLRALAALAATLCGATCTGAGITTAGIDAIANSSIQAKLAGAAAGIDGAVQPGLAELSAGLDLLASGVGELIDGVEAIKEGLQSGDAGDPGVIEGLEAVVSGLATAIAGIGAVGTEETLTDGVNRLFEGAQELGDGLGLIEEGAGDAKDGSSQIADGQRRLSSEGTQAIRTGVRGNLQTASQALAVLNEMKRRAASDAFLYGPPEGGTGSVAYVYEIAGITGRNLGSLLKFVVAAALIAGIAAAGAVARRRLA